MGDIYVKIMTKYCNIKKFEFPFLSLLNSKFHEILLCVLCAINSYLAIASAVGMLPLFQATRKQLRGHLKLYLEWNLKISKLIMKSILLSQQFGMKGKVELSLSIGLLALTGKESTLSHSASNVIDNTVLT